MSEVEHHYGHETPPARQADTTPKDPGLLDRVSSAVSQGADTVQQRADALRGSAKEAYAQASGWVSDGIDSTSRHATYARRRSAAEFNRGKRVVEGYVDDNPVMIGLAGIAAGLLLGALLPGTRQENRYLGRYADEVRTQGLRYAKDVAEQGRSLLEENLRQVQSGRERVG